MQKLKLYNDELLSTKRGKADALADLAIKEIYATQDNGLFNRIFDETRINEKEISEGLPKAVVHFFNESFLLPEWADLKKMSAGAAFFSKHAPQILLLLGFYSLPYCYAAANGARVLQITNRITDDPGKRFLETSEFVMDVMAPNAFEGRGKGIRSSQKVRLIHAIVRYHVSKSKEWNFDWGIPVNQEDMAGTNLSLSLIAIRGLRKMGIEVSPAEASSYMHLWNVIGYILGIDEILLPDSKKEAYLLDKLISKRQFRSSVAGQELSASLIAFIKSTAPTALPHGFVESYMRYFLGEKISDLLNIPFIPGSSALIRPFQSLNKINSMFEFNKRNYYQTHHLMKMQKKKMLN